MSEATALVKKVLDAPMEAYSEERIALIARTVAPPGTTADELSLYLSFCQARDLNPLLKQVYLMKNKGRIAIMTGIDGMRLLAQRSGEYEGQVGPEWRASADSPWDDVPPEGLPYACRVGVLRTGFKQPIWSVRKLSEFRRDGENWSQRPAHMLSIRAESDALRRAFPAETAGVTVHYEGGLQVAPTFSGDPDADLTYPQLGMLHKLAKQHEWTRSERLDEAGERLGHIVDSFSDLTRGEAHRLIDEWTNELEDEEASREESEDEAPRAAPVEEDVSERTSTSPGPERASSTPVAEAVGHLAESGSGDPLADPERASAHNVAAEETETVSPAPPTSAATNVQGKGGRTMTGKHGETPRPADTSEVAQGPSARVESPRTAESAEREASSDTHATGRSTRPGPGEGPPENAAKVAATPSASTHRFIGDGLLCEKCHGAEEQEDHKGAK